MHANYPILFSPLKIGPITLRNRIEAAPMGFSDNAPSGEFRRENVAMYRAFAKGGAAIVTVGGTAVDTFTGRAHDRATPLDNRDILPDLLEVSDAIRQHGAAASIELIHPGHRANPQYTGGPAIYSASAGTHHRYGQVYDAAEMTEDDIERTVEAYAKAACIGKAGGFQMCMVHGAGGWLISQFLSAAENRRADRFGGSLENRARFPLMIVERIRQKCGEDFPIEFRISGEAEVSEGLELARMLDGKVDLLHVSAPGFAGEDAMPGIFHPHACNADLSAGIKKHVRIPVITVGRAGSPERMEQLLREEQADMVAMARGLIADPELPRKAREGRGDEIVPCIHCNACLSGTFVPPGPDAGRAVRCTVNPTCGREIQSRLWDQPRRSYKVLVAGGGPAGMQAAITAADRGHEVILCERTGNLGGALLAVERLVFQRDMRDFRQSLVTRMKIRKVKVLMNTELTEELVRLIKPEVLIAAMGGTPVIPDLPGIGLEHVLLAGELQPEKKPVGQRVVVLGGGMAGVGEGLNFAMLGRAVTVLETAEEIAGDGDLHSRESLVRETGKYSNFKAVTGVRMLQITTAEVLAEDSTGNRFAFSADTVIVAAGRVPRSAEGMRDLSPDFAVVGDCLRPGSVMDAVKSGYNAAMNIY